MIEIRGYDELNKKLWENKDSDQVMMLYFGTSWCGPCKKLKEKIKIHGLIILLKIHL